MLSLRNVCKMNFLGTAPPTKNEKERLEVKSTIEIFTYEYPGF